MSGGRLSGGLKSYDRHGYIYSSQPDDKPVQCSRGNSIETRTVQRLKDLPTSSM